MDVVTAIRVVVIVVGALGAAFDIGWFVVLMHVRRTDGLVWQLAATALAKGVVGLIVDAVIISVGAGFFARPLAYVLAVAVAGNLVLRVYLRRRYPELLDVDD